MSKKMYFSIFFSVLKYYFSYEMVHSLKVLLYAIVINFYSKKKNDKKKEV